MPVLHRRSLRLSQATAALALATLLAAPAAAQTYDARADYSTTSNPNGVWTYGYATALGSAGTPATLTPYTNSEMVSGSAVHVWNMGNAFCGDGTPGVWRNGSAIPNGFTSWVLNPGALGLHPGCRGEFSIMRFTAPAAGFTAGAYDVVAAFRGADPGGSRTIGVFQNGTSLFSQLLNGGDNAGYTGALALAAGDVIDLVVGANGDYRFDMTEANLTVTGRGQQAPISAVPEPGTWALLATGLSALGLVSRRRARTPA